MYKRMQKSCQFKITNKFKYLDIFDGACYEHRMRFVSSKFAFHIIATIVCISLQSCKQEAPESTPAKTEAVTKVAPKEQKQSSEQTPKIAPLTEEDLELIAADPKDLSPELRRKRAFALRKKIMQNPDSPAAKQLEELRRAVEAGEIHPQVVRSQDQSLSPDAAETASNTPPEK